MKVYFLGISFEMSQWRAAICRLDRRILSGLNTRYFLPSGPSRSIQSLVLSSAISRVSSSRSSICILLASVYHFGAKFLAYVEQCLAPTLKRKDIEMLPNRFYHQRLDVGCRHPAD